MLGIFPFAMCICNVEVPLSKKRKFGKNPEVDTSFLPDRDREVMKHLWFRARCLSVHKLHHMGFPHT